MMLIGSADIAAAALTAAVTAFLDHIITEAVCGQQKICTHCVYGQEKFAHTTYAVKRKFAHTVCGQALP